MNPFEMVVLIVAIVMVASIFKAKYRAGGKAGIRLDAETRAENERMRAELDLLKDRVAVLERLATEDEAPRALNREIEKLRSRDA
ncbi:hypothetical protein GVO57_09035 [Sphingomonas changnyeongensis]|uniref:Phage shock protein B n=1 Tax=Sphingomonas changnyeongensis TaxID=2698679 RepID=A0A7Z2NW83_9SPHN|nr:hypothetical protein [Sphingomonas changnyeongensis]QHL90935.1 hypothetical protein GVO57_09035 [Sphingomonas changnyeongensis]